MTPRSGCAAVLAVAALVVYATAVEPRRITVTKVALPEGKMAAVLAGSTLALISDLHFGASEEPDGEAILGIVRQLKPDLILLAGDYVKWGANDQAYERALDFLGRLRAPLGVVAVLGDADYTLSRKSCEFCHVPGGGAPTKRHGVVLLRDSETAITTARGSVRIVGLDVGSRAAKDYRVRQLLQGEGPLLVLSHSSGVTGDIDAGREALILSGDTHGGQMWLPEWVWRLGRFKPDPAHPSGLYRDGKKVLYVTRGVGTSHVRFRLGAPPEIVLFEFEAPNGG